MTEDYTSRSKAAKQEMAPLTVRTAEAGSERGSSSTETQSSVKTESKAVTDKNLMELGQMYRNQTETPEEKVAALREEFSSKIDTLERNTRTDSGSVGMSEELTELQNRIAFWEGAAKK